MRRSKGLARVSALMGDEQNHRDQDDREPNAFYCPRRFNDPANHDHGDDGTEHDDPDLTSHGCGERTLA